MAHLELLVAEYLDWQGYLVKKNVKVGRLSHGGWEGELDVVGFHPREGEIVHYELSLDASPWAERERRYAKKMDAGRKYIHKELFPWLSTDVQIKQFAAFPTHGTRTELAGATLMSVDGLVQGIVSKIRGQGKANANAISEGYPLLRVLQFAHCGYSYAPKAS
jgi:hypothetical protein